jgi:hypothetical protein
MQYPKLFIVQAFLAVFIAAIHIPALVWSLYWHYVWLDVPVHFLGGFWLALAGSWMLLRGGMKADVAPVFSIVVTLGVAWELFELAAGVPVEENFALDTVIDVTSDVAGGILGFIFARALARRDTIVRNEEA